MPKSENAIPNQFCWVEVATSDPAAAKQFYGKIFGWQLEDMSSPHGVYTIAKLQGGNVAGLLLLPEDASKSGMTPHWMSYVAVTDAAAAEAKAKSLGGTVLKSVHDVGMGLMAVVQDPTGAVFALWQEKRSMGGYLYQETGACCWNELMTRNVDAAGAFYSKLFGWNADAVQMDGGMIYTVFKRGDEQLAGMMQTPEEMGGLPSHWGVYFAAESADRTADAVHANGGVVLQPPTDIPNIGRFATFADPQGAAFAVLQPFMPAGE